MPVGCGSQQKCLQQLLKAGAAPQLNGIQTVSKLVRPGACRNSACAPAELLTLWLGNGKCPTAHNV